MCYLQVGAENASLKPITDLLPKLKEPVRLFFINADNWFFFSSYSILTFTSLCHISNWINVGFQNHFLFFPTLFRVQKSSEPVPASFELKAILPSGNNEKTLSKYIFKIMYNLTDGYFLNPLNPLCNCTRLGWDGRFLSFAPT